MVLSNAHWDSTGNYKAVIVINIVIDADGGPLMEAKASEENSVNSTSLKDYNHFDLGPEGMDGDFLGIFLTYGPFSNIINSHLSVIVSCRRIYVSWLSHLTLK